MIAKIWSNRIIAGDKNFSECPEKYQDDVVKFLKEAIENGEFTEELFEEKTGLKFSEEE